jgi:hypothetical protein
MEMQSLLKEISDLTKLKIGETLGYSTNLGKPQEQYIKWEQLQKQKLIGGKTENYSHSTLAHQSSVREFICETDLLCNNINYVLRGSVVVQKLHVRSPIMKLGTRDEHCIFRSCLMTKLKSRQSKQVR